MNPLESCKLLAQLPPDELAGVKQAARPVKFSAGQVIFKEGDPGDGIYLLHSGQVEISAVLGQGERRPFTSVVPGEVFGEMAVIDGNPRSASATAAEDVTACFIARDDMLRLLDHSPVFSRNLIREISQRLREFNRQYIREVLQAERLALVGRFARTIVHDLKNPLNIIGLSADLMVRDSAAPEARQLGQKRIRKQVERINTMIFELLEYTRTTQTNTVMAATDYAAFVMPLLDEIALEVGLKNATVSVPEPAPAVTIAANTQRLSRVFYNLMHNATDAMPDGGQITVRFAVSGDQVVTEIQDSGEGISEEVLAHLFEPFFTHGKAQGTGLGLSICQRIINDHQGAIQAHNAPGGGAVFSFSLPLLRN